jgi:2-polyprenyl-6-methoxyphenol hydroxylase-like FAD-dependent oxidoreductase
MGVHRVLIVGAGPVGLTLAHVLAAHGVKFRIVDRKLEPNRGSKAVALNVASQLSYELLRIRDEVAGAAWQVRRLNPSWCGLRLNPVLLSRIPGPRKTFLTQPQELTERGLLRAFRRDVVEWRTEVEALEQSEDSVEVFLRSNGDVERARFDYVVGCDGKHGVVRHAVGIGMEGRDYGSHFMLGDFSLDWGRAPDQVYYDVFPDTFLISVPLGPQRWRLLLHRPGADGPGRVSEALLRSEVVRLLGAGVRLGSPEWLSSAEFYLRVADSFSKHRVALCGDAAHLFSPIGGTGMNTGIQDAMALGFRLAESVARGAPSQLDAYSEERRLVVRRTAEATDRNTRLICGVERTELDVAPWLPRVRNRSLIRDVFPSAFSGLGGHVLGTEGAFCLALPELRARVLGDGVGALGSWCLLMRAPGPELAKLRELTLELRGVVEVLSIADEHIAEDERLSDLARDCALAEGTFVLVRPDGLIHRVDSLASRGALSSALRLVVPQGTERLRGVS